MPLKSLVGQRLIGALTAAALLSLIPADGRSAGIEGGPLVQDIGEFGATAPAWTEPLALVGMLCPSREIHVEILHTEAREVVSDGDVTFKVRWVDEAGPDETYGAGRASELPDEFIPAEGTHGTVGGDTCTMYTDSLWIAVILPPSRERIAIASDIWITYRADGRLYREHLPMTLKMCPAEPTSNVEASSYYQEYCIDDRE